MSCGGGKSEETCSFTGVSQHCVEVVHWYSLIQFLSGHWLDKQMKNEGKQRPSPQRAVSEPPERRWYDDFSVTARSSNIRREENELWKPERATERFKATAWEQRDGGCFFWRTDTRAECCVRAAVKLSASLLILWVFHFSVLWTDGRLCVTVVYREGLAERTNIQWGKQTPIEGLKLGYATAWSVSDKSQS